MSAADQVRELIKSEVVPVLRGMGFKGSFPHFYRERGSHVDLVWFTFGSAGTSFAVELSFADVRRANVYFRPETPPSKLRVAQTKTRHRLGSGEGGDFWFAFKGERHRGMTGQPAELISEVLELLPTEAETWWRAQNAG